MQTRNGKTYLDAAPDGNENIYPYMWLKSHKSQRKKQIVSLAAYENGVTHMHLQLFECVCGSPTRIHQCVCEWVGIGFSLFFQTQHNGP